MLHTSAACKPSCQVYLRNFCEYGHGVLISNVTSGVSVITLWSRPGWMSLWALVKGVSACGVGVGARESWRSLPIQWFWWSTDSDALLWKTVFQTRLFLHFEMFFSVRLEQAKGSLIILLFFCSVFMRSRNRTCYTFKNDWVGVFLP